MPGVTKETMVLDFIGGSSEFIDTVFTRWDFWVLHVGFFVVMTFFSILFLILIVRPQIGNPGCLDRQVLVKTRLRFLTLFYLINTWSQMFLIDDFGAVLYLKANWLWHVLDVTNFWTSLRPLWQP
ncbi:hypothetical protein MNBD_GAMMA12-599 [hydrothermal vent metagenome]|uniref:Uncharacterized protein n=1 Tax=hydrothermal vent metagenome TaxID=652676 RepID=A0A3B0Z5J9_9ZZZZ